MNKTMKTSRAALPESVTNKIADVSFDISKLSKRLTQSDALFELLDSQLKDEAKLRQNIEKKTFLMNESLNEQIKSIKSGFNTLSTTIEDQMETLKATIIEDVQSSNLKSLKSFEAKMLKFEEYEKIITAYEQNKQIEAMNLDKKISILEDVVTNQLNTIKIELKATQDRNEMISKQIDSNSLMITDSIRQTNKELNAIKADVDMFKRYKLASSETFGKISDDIIYSNEQMTKCANDIANAISETETKMKQFENAFNRLNESFGVIKSDIYIQLDDMKDNYSKKLEKINSEMINDIKASKIAMDKFSVNMIEENQKFIKFNQDLLQNQSVNMKKLYDFTNDDVDILKKKCESIETLTKTMRSDLINNINNVESFLTQRYDSIFRTLGSERSIR